MSEINEGLERFLDITFKAIPYRECHTEFVISAEQMEIITKVILPLIHRHLKASKGMPAKKPLPGLVDYAQSMSGVFVGTESEYKQRQKAEIYNQAIDEITTYLASQPAGWPEKITKNPCEGCTHNRGKGDCIRRNVCREIIAYIARRPRNELIDQCAVAAAKLEPAEVNKALEYYIQDKRQYVGNSMLWWAKDSKGYSCDIRNAQVFSKEEAEEICSNRNTDIMWLKSYIGQRISSHIDMQHVDIGQVGAESLTKEGK